MQPTDTAAPPMHATSRVRVSYVVFFPAVSQTSHDGTLSRLLIFSTCLSVEELGSALEIAEPDDFRRRYHFDPPAASDVIVMQSRCDTRAQWAGQIAWDAGLTK